MKSLKLILNNTICLILGHGDWGVFVNMAEYANYIYIVKCRRCNYIQFEGRPPTGWIVLRGYWG